MFGKNSIMIDERELSSPSVSNPRVWIIDFAIAASVVALAAALMNSYMG
jgi:hypothetical protein